MMCNTSWSEKTNARDRELSDILGTAELVATKFQDLADVLITQPMYNMETTLRLHARIEV